MKPLIILLVGGGTGGHIFPLYPLAKKLLNQGQKVQLIVNESPLDHQIIADKFSNLKDLKVHYLKTHKIDYHFSFRNLVAPFKIINSFFRTHLLIKKIKPDVVFFKGGFVGFPVLIALKYLTRFKGKIYLHDSDISAGALTKFIGKSADHVFNNFGKAATPLFYWPENLETGLQNSVRTLNNNLKTKFELSTNSKPKILVFGGSQGAQFLNNLFAQNLQTLTKKYHLTIVAGPKNNLGVQHENLEIHNFMPQDDLIKAIIESDVVVCRSGASMFQVLAAKTKCIAVPLPSSARNHQLHNAQYFTDKGLSYLLEQNESTSKKLLTLIAAVLKDKKLEKTLATYEGSPQFEKIINVITK
jgi:UDP-N-acetylglucosamine--N-acetylmuramyl-(pentapeptide) pyrophosphoryl-undecaprenol N-acetylglucosamine transferase